MVTKNLHLIGYASGLAGADVRTGEGPIVIQKSPYLKDLTKQGLAFHWEEMFHPDTQNSQKKDQAIKKLCEKLAKKVSELTAQHKWFSVVGGDHACAIGTWSGVYDAVHKKGPLGLIWIDAHMDSHTPETSQSGRIHGMPLATLLGRGNAELTSILKVGPKFKPEHVCLIGVRSYEPGEKELLKQLNVRIYFMDEVKQRGFETVLQEAIDIVTRGTSGYGLSLDMDGIDPSEAPGVDVPEPNGIYARDIHNALAKIVNDPRLIATEIVEFDPSRDKNHMTEKLVATYLGLIANAER